MEFIDLEALKFSATMFNMIVMLTLGIIWSRSSFLNICIKLVLFVGGLGNGIWLLQQLGYIVKM